MRKLPLPATAALVVALALTASCSTQVAPPPTAASAAAVSTVVSSTAQATIAPPDKGTLPVMPTLPTIEEPTVEATVPPGADPTPVTSAPTTVADVGTPVTLYVSVDGRANVRKKPSRSAAVVDRLNRGTVVNAAPVADGAWYRIAEERYIAASVVSRTKPTAPKAVSTVATAPVTTAPKAVTPAARFDACVDQVDPTRTAKWFFQSKGPWGQTWIPEEEIYVSPAVPSNRVCDVVRHEWMHILQSRAWGPDLFNETNRILGTTGRTPVDQVADCGAELLGATWVHYGCKTAAERSLAADLLAGRF